MGQTRFVHEMRVDGVRSIGPSEVDSALRTRPGVDDTEEGARREAQGQVWLLEERTEHAKKYYSDRDPEASLPGGRVAMQSHPLEEQSSQHGLGHHGGLAEP